MPFYFCFSLFLYCEQTGSFDMSHSLGSSTHAPSQGFNRNTRASHLWRAEVSNLLDGGKTMILHLKTQISNELSIFVLANQRPVSSGAY